MGACACVTVRAADKAGLGCAWTVDSGGTVDSWAQKTRVLASEAAATKARVGGGQRWNAVGSPGCGHLTRWLARAVASGGLT